MKWLLMWLNVSVATLNATLQLLVIYRYRYRCVKFTHFSIIHTKFEYSFKEPRM